MKRESLLVLLLVFVLLLIGCAGKEEITGQQMVMAQIEFTESYFSIMDEIAEVYSEYIAFNISEQNFKEHITEYLKRIELEEKRYEEFNEKYILNPENVDKNVLRAIALSEEARSLVKSVLEKTIDKGRALPREELLELYIERAGKIQDIMDEFKKVVDMIE
jgi:hypothetical protein